MNDQELIGRLLFWRRNSTFLEILSIEKGSGMMVVRDWRTNERSTEHFASEIGPEYYLVSDDYPPEKIIQYCKAADMADDAVSAMMGVEIEIGFDTETVVEINRDTHH